MKRREEGYVGKGIMEMKKAKEKADGFGVRRHGKGWSYGERRSRSGQMENTFTLWPPRIGRSRKKKKIYGESFARL